MHGCSQSFVDDRCLCSMSLRVLVRYNSNKKCKNSEILQFIDAPMECVFNVPLQNCYQNNLNNNDIAYFHTISFFHQKTKICLLFILVILLMTQSAYPFPAVKSPSGLMGGKLLTFFRINKQLYICINTYTHIFLPPFSPQFQSCLIAATPQLAQEAKVESCVLVMRTRATKPNFITPVCLPRKPAAPTCRRKHRSNGVSLKAPGPPQRFARERRAN